MHDTELGKKDERRAQISSAGHKLLYEIHPIVYNLNKILNCAQVNYNKKYFFAIQIWAQFFVQRTLFG
jgi:polyferredoxin